MNQIVIHYGEIGTKGDNRLFFEKKLIDNIKFALNSSYNSVLRKYGKILITLKPDYDFEKVVNILKKIPGISHFSFCKEIKNDLTEMKKTSLELLKDKDFNTFKIDSKRQNKNYKYKSPQINELIGEFILKNLDKKVKLKNPDTQVYLEVSDTTLIYTQRINGIKGLPVGVSTKVCSSLSGGIDSPVSSFLMNKRGCEVVYVHIYNNHLAKDNILKKIKLLVKKLTKFQHKAKLYIIPFYKIQRHIIAHIPSKYRMIIYRRFMFYILNEISNLENAKAIVTGDSIGQVASQTIQNITSIYDASKFPVFSPLIGFDKLEIINLSKKINTYDTSIIPYPDCCSFMLSKHPETRSLLDEITNLEKSILSKDEIIKDAIDNLTIYNFKYSLKDYYE